VVLRFEAVMTGEDPANVSCALRSVAEVGLSARTREYGALLERWRAQLRSCNSTIQDRATVRITSPDPRLCTVVLSDEGIESPA